MEKSGQEPTLRGRIRVPSGIREFPPVRRYLIIPLFAALLAPALRASPATITIASRTLPRTVTVGGHTLALNGAGVRYYAVFFRVYVGALYLPTPTHSAHVALAEHGPDRIVMDFLRGVGHGDLVSAWKSGFRRNNPPTVRRALAPGARGAIVGSALIERCTKDPASVPDYLDALRAATLFPPG
jgi:hypothetical protein